MRKRYVWHSVSAEALRVDYVSSEARRIGSVTAEAPGAKQIWFIDITVPSTWK